MWSRPSDGSGYRVANLAADGPKAGVREWVRPERPVRPVDLLIMVAVAAAVTSIVVTDSLNGWPGPVLVIAFFTFVFTRRTAHPERSGLPRSELLSTPADGAVSRSGPDWIAIVLTGVGVLLIAGVVLVVLVIYIGLAGCVPVVGSAVGAPCD